MNQRRGRTSEKQFSLLCSEAGFTCNKSDEDDHGWDFFVEIPYDHQEHLMPDLKKSTRQILVQVKSTTTKKSRVIVKTSNAINFAKSELPCFVVLFQNEIGKKPKIFAVHYWSDLIESSLKRARVLGANFLNTHQDNFSINFTAEDEHTDDLISWISTNVRGFPDNYAGVKRELNDTLGYQEGNLRGKISFGPTVGLDELVDHQLGLTETIPVSFIHLTETRFGIDSATPVFSGVPTFVTMKSGMKRDVKVLLQSADGDSFTLKAELTLPSIPGLPFEKMKVKIDTWMFSATALNGVTTGFTLKVSTDQKLLFSELLEFSKLVTWCNLGSVEFRVFGGNLKLMDGSLSLSKGETRSYLSNTLKICTLLSEITERTGISDVKLSLRDIGLAWDRLVDFNRIVMSTIANLTFVHGPEWESDVKYSKVYYHVVVGVGDLCFFVVLESAVKSQIDNDVSVALSLERPVWRDCLVGSNPSEIAEAGLKSYDNRLQSASGYILGLGDILPFFDSEG